VGRIILGGTTQNGTTGYKKGELKKDIEKRFIIYATQQKRTVTKRNRQDKPGQRKYKR